MIVFLLLLSSPKMTMFVVYLIQENGISFWSNWQDQLQMLLEAFTAFTATWILCENQSLSIVCGFIPSHRKETLESIGFESFKITITMMMVDWSIECFFCLYPVYYKLQEE